MSVRCLKVLAAAAWMASAAHAAPVVPATRSIVTRLRHFEVEELETDIPPAVARDLTALKHALLLKVLRIGKSPGSPRVLADRTVRSRMGKRDPAACLGRDTESGERAKRRSWS